MSLAYPNKFTQVHGPETTILWRPQHHRKVQRVKMDTLPMIQIASRQMNGTLIPGIVVDADVRRRR